MAKFKIGEKVRILSRKDGDSSGEYKFMFEKAIGKVGTVTTHYPSSDDYRVDNGDNYYGVNFRDCDLELIEYPAPQYQPITPKVGDKFKLIKGIYNASIGGIYQVEKWESGWHLKKTNDGACYVGTIIKEDVNSFFTSEYLEPLKEEKRVGCNTIKLPKKWGELKCGDIKAMDYRKELPSLKNVYIGEFTGFELNGEPIIKPKKLTFMQKLTSAIKKVLSPQLQKFYQVGYIDTGLTLTSTGRNEYVEALFQNEGDHTKALTDMETLADTTIAESKE